MTTPNITSPIHAAGIIDLNGAIIAGTIVNINQSVRNGAGDYTITMASEIDAADRYISIIGIEDGDFTFELIGAGNTDTQFQIQSRTAAVLTDAGFAFCVFRIRQPG
ncbi:hypothetical protein LCGC14_2033210 [marine sediment metagenome]|uniref:Uncharacterized protein n=1 Tax=marine sediment metagenome TaxID=412755 RepID=A0A0F9H7J1_9ZZZZ